MRPDVLEAEELRHLRPLVDLLHVDGRRIEGVGHVTQQHAVPKRWIRGCVIPPAARVCVFSCLRVYATSSMVASGQTTRWFSGSTSSRSSHPAHCLHSSVILALLGGGRLGDSGSDVELVGPRHDLQDEEKGDI